MYQGETITTTITGFPFPISEIKELKIVFRNNMKTLLEKTLADCTVSETGDSLSFELSQLESLSLCVGKIERTVIVVTRDGTRMESCPSHILCMPTVKEEVL